MQPNPARPLVPRGIFDKGTRRKAVAVAGAAMELRSPIGLHGYGEEAVGAGLDKAARQIVHQGTSGLVNCMRVGVGHKAGSLHRRHTWAETWCHIFAGPCIGLGSGSVGKVASKCQLLRGEVRSDVHVGSAAWATPGS